MRNALPGPPEPDIKMLESEVLRLRRRVTALEERLEAVEAALAP